MNTSVCVLQSEEFILAQELVKGDFIRQISLK